MCSVADTHGHRSLADACQAWPQVGAPHAKAAAVLAQVTVEQRRHVSLFITFESVGAPTASQHDRFALSGRSTACGTHTMAPGLSRGTPSAMTCAAARGLRLLAHAFCASLSLHPRLAGSLRGCWLTGNPADKIIHLFASVRSETPVRCSLPRSPCVASRSYAHGGGKGKGTQGCAGMAPRAAYTLPRAQYCPLDAGPRGRHSLGRAPGRRIRAIMKQYCVFPGPTQPLHKGEGNFYSDSS